MWLADVTLGISDVLNSQSIFIFFEKTYRGIACRAKPGEKFDETILCQCLHPVFFVHGSKKNNFFVGDLLPIL
jgi:hypothetical protein